MLKFFKKLERTRNFVLLLFALVMVASLVLFYAPTRDNAPDTLARSEEAVATVKGETVTVGELYRQKENYSRMAGGATFPAKFMLNQLISGRIMRVEADRLGLTATDTEVARLIHEQYKPTDGKPFDQAAYERMAVQQAGTVSAFEQAIRDELSARKLEAFLTAGVTVSEEEVLEDFKKKNTKFDLSYVMVNPTELAQTITPTEEQLREYFEQNKQAYYISLPQKKIRYVYISTTKLGEKLPITDAELQAEYDKLPADKKIAGVRGQEIVLRIPKPEFEGDILEKANELVDRLKRSGEPVSEEAFAELAKGHSENPATAPAGGALPRPVRENLNNPNDPYQRLLKMQPGQISEPISYQGRYFILRRGEEVPKTLEEAKKELDVSLRNRKAYAAAAELANKVTETLKQNKDVQATAQQYAAEANMSVAEMVRETPYVKPNDNIENIGTSPQFEQGIAGLENPQDVGDKIPVQGGFAVPLLVDQRPPRDAEFDEVRAQLVEVVKLEQARARVKEIADKIAAGTATAADLASVATANGLKAQEQKGYIIGSPLGQGPAASTSEALSDAIYGLQAGGVTKTPIMAGDNYYIVGVSNRQEASMDEFAQQRDDLTEQMLQTKRQQVFTDYLAATRQRMEADGDIRIYQDALAKVDEPLLPEPVE